jgi:Domain of unknown function (DUF4168)
MRRRLSWDFVGIRRADRYFGIQGEPMRAVVQCLVLAAVGAATLLSVPAANAQSQMPSQPQAAAPSADISDQKLDAVAKAMQSVASVRESYKRKIDAAAPADKPRLKSEGNQALKKALSDQGLTVDEYNRVMTIAQNDPTVRAKLLQRLHQPDQSQ